MSPKRVPRSSSAETLRARGGATDREAIDQSDIDNGTLDIVVGVAPVNPAEFVIVDIAQFASESEPNTPRRPPVRKKKKKQ